MSIHLSVGRSFTILSLVLVCAQAPAKILREDIGELKIHDLLLRPNFMLKEPKQGSFSIGESSFALRWELQAKYSSVVRIGPRSLLNPLARYSATVNDDVLLVEAFGEYEDDYGRYRLGRIPVEFGYEGRQWERTLIFPRSLLFQERAMMLRDVGFAYDVEHNNFFTGLVVHNGESDSDVDGRLWYTARWGFRNDDFEFGLNGQTGSTKPTSTASSSDTLAAVDPTREAQWRIMGIHVASTRKQFEWVLELYSGEREQLKQIGRFNAGHLDLNYLSSKTFSAHLRYDQMSRNVSDAATLERQVSLALVFSNKTRSSNLILVGTKVMEKSNVPNDELRLIWNLSPSGVVRF